MSFDFDTGKVCSILKNQSESAFVLAKKSRQYKAGKGIGNSIGRYFYW
jgi:hypothetical protein